MSKYRNALPQLSSKKFLTDGGLETTLVFHDEIDLPFFAAFGLLKTAEGTRRLQDYYRRYAKIAVNNELGFVLESATWRASPDWAKQMGYSKSELDVINKHSIAMLEQLRDEFENNHSPMVVSGCVGPRGDGYNPESFMTSEQAQQYHSEQIGSFADSTADMVTAMTITYVEEAIGIIKAAVKKNMPVAISFTLETDGRLPSGQSLKDAIEQVDQATNSATAYFMINCAHPEHFEDIFNDEGAWMQRIQGIRANASRMSHAELDQSETLDDGNPLELGLAYGAFSKILTHLNVFGGCCGTDHRHVDAICQSVVTV